MAVTCPTCQAELADGARFCPRDGTTIRPSEAANGAGDAALVRPSIRQTGPAVPTGDGSDDDPLVGRVLDGRYRVGAPLGAGGVGTVYAGEHVELKKRVAIKILHAVFGRTEEFRKRFEREARAASRLSHPACVSVLDFGRIERVEPPGGADRFIGAPYLVMEFVSGELLLDRMEKGKIPAPEAIVIARGVLSALRHAHSLDIVHRDVKPGNIMFSSGAMTAPMVKLLDFGLAKNIGEDSADSKQALTQAGLVFGTPGYLSPEQASGQQADARADLYSLGVVLFEMVCGRPPFVRERALEIVRDHLLLASPAPRSINPLISAELEQVILKTLEKKPAARYQTAEEMQAALAACPEGSSANLPSVRAPSGRTDAGNARAISLAPLTGARARLVDFVRRHRGGVLAVTGALMLNVVAGLVVAILLRGRASPPPIRAAAPRAPAITAPRATSSAQRHLSLAEDYQRRLWCGDAIDELERALREQPELRASPELARLAIPCLRTKTRAKTIRFLVDQLGDTSKAELEEAAADDSRAEIRDGARRALDELAAKPSG